MIIDIPKPADLPPDAIVRALQALADLCAADNTNYQRDLMRYAGLFDAARKALLDCGIDRRRGENNPEYIGMFPPSRLSMHDTFYLEETHKAVSRLKEEFDRLYESFVAGNGQLEKEADPS